MTDAAPRYTSVIATRTSRWALLGLVIIVILLALAPGFVPRAYVQDLLLMFLLVTISQCWNLLAGFAGLISVGQQAFVGLGGYALFGLIVTFGLDPLAALPLAAVIVAVIAVPVGFVVFRMRGAYFAVVTWVVAEVFRLLMAQWKALGGGTGNSLPRQATSDMAGIDMVSKLMHMRSPVARETIIYWLALIVMVVAIFVVYRLLRSRFGLALSAIRDGEVAAESVGVDITGTKFVIYVLAAFGASIAGALYFLQQGRISPDAAFTVLDWTAYVIFIVVIGGIGTIEGPILGTIIFVVLQQSLSDFGPWYLILLGGLGITVMLVAPKGLWGIFSARTGIHLFPTRRRLIQLDGPATGKD
jgi:branched-chain amino acid transport system permease protein